MPYNEFRAQLITILQLTDVSIERQDNILQKIESIARKRLALAIPDMLTPEQLDEIEGMRIKSIPEDDIMQWAVARLPAPFDAMLQTTMLGVAEELPRRPQ